MRILLIFIGLSIVAGCNQITGMDELKYVEKDSSSATSSDTGITSSDNLGLVDSQTTTDTDDSASSLIDSATDTVTSFGTETESSSATGAGTDSADTGTGTSTDATGGTDSASDTTDVCAGCQIGDLCVENGNLNENDSCQICDVASSPGSWTQRDPADCCTPNDHRVCDSDGNVRFVDSCGNQGSVVETCLPSGSNGACSNGWCGCKEGFTGALCDQCLIYVDGTRPDDTGTGTGWATAKATVQAGIDAAATKGCAEVWVAKGTYTPNASVNRTVSIELAENAVVRGGFAGNELSADERVNGNETIFSGNIGNKASADDNSYHVVIGAPGATLERVTVQDGGAPDGAGGGIYYDNSNLTATFRIVNVHIQNNQAAKGGGVYSGMGQIIIESSVFSDNEATTGGGAYFFYPVGEENSVVDSRFENNHASENGGAIYFYDDGLVRNCEFVNNSADSRAGAIYADGSISFNLLVTSSYFSGNTASLGGAVCNYSYAGNIILISDVFEDNSAVENGGAVYTLSGTTVGCRFSRNSAGAKGGAIYHGQKADGSIYSSLFVDNQAVEGGAMYNDSYAGQRIVNCTIVNNEATSLGGAIFDNIDTLSRLANTILWGNAALADSSGNHILSSNGYTSVAYSIIENGCQTAVLDCGDGNITASPAFVDAAAGDYHLTSTSPAIETGDNDSLPTDFVDWNEDGRTSDLLPYDLDKNPRIVNGDGIGTAAVDIGAYEYQP
ncbi:MAG: hypothetical protein JXR76_17350 [Deltaproteobacteria bacterium]|nr:hypothetical protein [Deltaproteobacteria bacterium]